MTKTEILIDKGFISPDWAEAIPEVFTYFYDKIAPVLKERSKEVVIYPDGLHIFRAFKECPYKDLKVVILGQDPYHDGSATGLAFDNIGNKMRLSPSLQNIRKELANDGGKLWQDVSPSRGSYLGYMATQGVLLLNTALTVEAGTPESHTELWKPFTKNLIEKLNEKEDLIWVLWGNYAKGFEKVINPKHHILKGTHPVPMSANRGGFFGGKYFSKANAILKSLNKKEIVW